ncbi:MAG: phage/plasmid primase, P4 family [Pirellulaceae bacterium]
MLEIANAYLTRGWSVIPVPHRAKKPILSAWQQMRLTHEYLPGHFNGKPQNIGVLTGEPSGWLIDIDLDHMRAVELASQFLPQTPAMFGREGKPRSHWLYKVNGPIATKKYRSKSAGMIVEFRSTGCQTVFPPSLHESGQTIEWVDSDADPAEVDSQFLIEAVTALADAVKIELGEKTEKRPPKDKKKVTPTPTPAENANDSSASGISTRCLKAMLRIGVVDHKDGSFRLFVAACRTVEHDLSEASALATINEYAKQKPFPRSWSDAEILERVRDAEARCERGSALSRDEQGCIGLGARDPQSGKLVLSPRKTLPTADAFVRDFYLHRGGKMLWCHTGRLLEWSDNRYAEIEDNAVKQRLQAWLHEALRYIQRPHADEPELVSFESNPGTVKAALESIRAATHLSADTESPSWLRNQPAGVKAADVLPCRSSLLHLPTMKRYPPTPAFFTFNALDYDPDPEAKPPQAWIDFVTQVFDGDRESINLLQEWFGYCLTGDNSQQKMLLIVGPKRSGKGTIARILSKLIGTSNVCGPTTSSLAGPFGLQPLLGKTLAVVSDARFHGENIMTVVERLLCISGEDTVTVDRKHMISTTLKLKTRFMFLSNELPRFQDSSGALPGRFVILAMTQSFYGKEDIGLTDRLLVELPGILNWAIEGWRRLRERGQFLMPLAVEEMVQEMQDLASPLGAFVRDSCYVGPGVPGDGR